MKRLGFFAALPFLLALTTPVVVTWSAPATVVRTRSPGTASVRVRASLIPGWHIYSMTQKPGGPKPLTFALEKAPGFSLGPVSGPKPENKYDAEFRTNTEVYSGEAIFVVPVRWTKPLAPGDTELKVIVRYMACSDKLCLPPRKETLTALIKQSGGK
ncbi:MAG: protein-disulfide reductase DsbD N-terminal domain-containing protein [Gemmatimonadaceae bacterium]|nr:protein-disulfide reductase DsbD N-terminal domain-containing protein [Gemmatimonadaceae bacterium]